MNTPFVTKNLNLRVKFFFSIIASSFETRLISHMHAEDGELHIEYSDDEELKQKYGEADNKAIHHILLELFDTPDIGLSVIFSAHDRGWFIFDIPNYSIIVDTETHSIETYPEPDAIQEHVDILTDTVKKFIEVLWKN